MPTFCIERSRWEEGDQGRKFVATKTTALAPKGVRGAAKFEQSQSEVWSTVATQKDSATKQELAKNTNSSANELLDAPKLQKLSSEHAAATARYNLQEIADKDFVEDVRLRLLRIP